MFSLIAPAWSVQIAGLGFTRIKRFDVISGRTSPVDLAEVLLPAEGVPLSEVKKGAAVEIRQGYESGGAGVTLIFAGSAHDVQVRGKEIMVQCRDRMQRLAETKVSQSFVRVAPQEVIAFCLERAGVDDYRLSGQRLMQRPSFVAQGPVTEVLRAVGRTWGITHFASWFDPEGTFNWMPMEESDRYLAEDLTILEYGENVLENRLLEDGDAGELDAFSMPWLRHTQRAILRDRRIWQDDQVVVLDQVHYHQSNEKARSFIRWRLIGSN